ncbi:MAG TPA: prolyl oligopeptidase family serine peptidase [Vicinamibacteria bacterium]|nr:prolyl oligopeptidase family serine peptidase [Vicinamibacteria bacterium]
MRTSSPPPPTRTEDVVDVRHGVEVRDPYRWLEDGDAEEVRRWSEAQGRHTRAALDAIPFTAAIRERLRVLFSIGLVSAPAVRGDRYFHQRRTGDQEQPVLYLRQGREGEDRVLLDPARFAEDRTSALDWYYPSDDGRRLAYGVSEGGSEKSVLRILDVDTGRDLADVIPFTRACSLEWRPDGSGFFYTRYPEPGSVPPGEENYRRRVYEHVLARDWREDPLVFGADRPPEDWANVHLSPDGRWLAVSVSRGWTRTDVYLRELASPDSPFVTVIEGLDAIFGVDLRNDRLYLQTNLDAPRSRLVAADLETPGRESWRDVLPEGPDVLEGTALIGDWIVAVWLRDASSRVTLHARDGTLLHEVALPVIGSVAGLTGEWDGREAFLGFTSYAVPPTVYRLALPDPALGLWARAPGEVDADRFRVRLVHYPSRDGTLVSMFLVDARDRPTDGRGAALLTGYGGFNVSHTPAFGRGVIQFLEKGGLYAVAHLRGGGEYGEDWHRQGMLDRKQNVFDDFLGAADFLLEQGHAGRGRLAIMGGSNGGLLVGAALTQRPGLFRAVVCQVPLLDMVRYHLFRIARLWIPEYGSADDPEAFRWLYAYSPYHHVRDGTPYPAVLITTGESDSRVDPLHARKMAARLQAATSSDHPILVRVETRAGHGQGKPLSKTLEEWTDVWAFVFSELSLAV